MGLQRTVAPATMPIDRAELADYLKIPADQLSAQATHLDALQAAAVERCERVADRALITQTWRLTLDDFADAQNGAYWDCRFGWTVPLPRPPLQSLTIAYVDTAGASQTLSSSGYTVDTNSTPGRVVPAYGQSWPTVRNQPGAVTITFVAGYGLTGASVPDEIKARLKAYCSYCNEHRGDIDLDEQLLDAIFLRFWTGRF